MDTLETAAKAVNVAIESIKAIGETKKTNAMLRKLISVKADIESAITKERVMGEIPVSRKKPKEE